MSTNLCLTLYPFPGTHHDAAPVYFYWYADTPDELEVRDERGLVIDSVPLCRGEGPIQAYITAATEDYCADHGINPADCSEEWGTPT